MTLETSASYGVLAALYAVVGVPALYMSCALISGSRTWTRQKAVHVIISLLCIARCAFFAASPAWNGVFFYVRMSSEDAYQTGLYVLEELPTMLLITLHSLQLLAWAEGSSDSTAHAQAEQLRLGRAYSAVGMSSPPAGGAARPGPGRGGGGGSGGGGGRGGGCSSYLPRASARNIFAANALLYAAQIVIWVAYDRTQGKIDSDIWSLVAAALHLAAVLLVAAGLLLYGVRMRAAVLGAPAGLAMRVKQQCTINAVVIICTLAFTVRAAALAAAAWASFTDAGGFDDGATSADTAMTAVFFLVTELVPMGIVLWYNSRRPRARGMPGAGRAKRGGGGAGGGASADGARGGGGSANKRPRTVGSALRSMRFQFSPIASSSGKRADGAAGPVGRDGAVAGAGAGAATTPKTVTRSFSFFSGARKKTPGEGEGGDGSAAAAAAGAGAGAGGPAGPSEKTPLIPRGAASGGSSPLSLSAHAPRPVEGAEEHDGDEEDSEDALVRVGKAAEAAAAAATTTPSAKAKKGRRERQKGGGRGEEEDGEEEERQKDEDDTPFSPAAVVSTPSALGRLGAEEEEEDREEGADDENDAVGGRDKP